MQLKRDTDYAIRILYCLRQNGDVGHTGERKGMTLSEIAMQTGTPKLVAGRVCESLKKTGLIAAAGAFALTGGVQRDGAAWRALLPAALAVALALLLSPPRDTTLPSLARVTRGCAGAVWAGALSPPKPAKGLGRGFSASGGSTISASSI